MQEYGLKIFYTGMGLFVLAMLMSIRSLQACSEKRLEWIFLFGAFKEVLADKPNIKRPYEEYKISNKAKNNIPLYRMRTLVYSKCFYLGECHNYDYRLSNVKVLGQGYKMTNAEQIEKITNAAQCFALLEILKFSAAKS